MFIFLTRLRRLFVGTVVVIGVTTILGLGPLTSDAVPVASHHSSHTTGTSTLTLVLLNSTDGLPHYGQAVTFTISTTATSYPHVSLYCYQKGVLVYTAAAGFYPSYPLPGSHTFILATGSWTAACA